MNDHSITFAPALARFLRAHALCIPCVNPRASIVAVLCLVSSPSRSLPWLHSRHMSKTRITIFRLLLEIPHIWFHPVSAACSWRHSQSTPESLAAGMPSVATHGLSRPCAFLAPVLRSKKHIHNMSPAGLCRWLCIGKLMLLLPPSCANTMFGKIVQWWCLLSQ